MAEALQMVRQVSWEFPNFTTWQMVYFFVVITTIATFELLA